MQRPVERNYGKLPRNSQAVRLCFQVKPRRDESMYNEGSLYHLKEINLLYEKAPRQDSTHRIFSEDAANHYFIEKTDSEFGSDQAEKDASFLADSRSITMQKSRNGLSNQIMPYRHETLSGARNLSLQGTMYNDELNPSNLTMKTISLPNNNADKAELLRNYRSLVLAKQQYRQSLDKSIDHYTRNALETKYFAVTEALVTLEEKLKNTKYGKKLAALKQRILETSNLFNATNQLRATNELKDTSTLLHFTPKAKLSSSRKEKGLKARNKSMTKNLSLNENFNSIGDSNRTISFDEKFGPSSNLNSFSDFNKHPQVVTDPNNNTIAKCFVSHERERHSQLKTDKKILSAANVISDKDKTFVSQYTRTEGLSLGRTAMGREEIVSRAMELRKSYQKLERARSKARKELENEIENEKLRENIENEYFKVQLKLERLRQKLKSLAGEAGMDWKELFAIIDVVNDDENDDDDDFGYGSLGGMFSSKVSHSTVKKNEIDEKISSFKSTSASRSSDNSIIDRRMAFDQDFEDEFSESDEFSKVEGSKPSKMSNLENKSVQTEVLEYNNNKDIYSIRTAEEKQSMHPASDEKIVLDENQNYVNIPESHCMPSLDMFADLEEKLEPSVDDATNEMDVVRKKRLAYFNKAVNEDVLEKMSDDPVQACEMQDQNSYSTQFLHDLDIESEVSIDTKLIDEYEGRLSESPSAIASRLTQRKTTPENCNGLIIKRSPDSKQDVRARLLEKPVLYDVSDLSSQGTVSDTLLNVKDLKDHSNSFYDDESESDTDVIYRLYDVPDFENPGNPNDAGDDSLQGTMKQDSISEFLRYKDNAMEDVLGNDCVVDSSAVTKYTPVNSQMSHTKERLQQKETLDWLRYNELKDDREGPQISEDSPSTSYNSMRSRIANIREKLQQRTRSGSSGSESTINQSGTPEGRHSESNFESFESRIDSIRQKLQQNKERLSSSNDGIVVGSSDWRSETSVKSNVEDIRHKLQQKRFMNSNNDISSLEKSNVDIHHENGRENEPKDVKSTFADLKQMENSEVFEYENDLDIHAPPERYSTTKNIKEDEIEATEVEGIQTAPFEESLQNAVDSGEFEEMNNTLRKEQHDGPQHDIDGMVFENRKEDSFEISFDMLEIDDNQQCQGSWHDGEDALIMEDENSLRKTLGLDGEPEKYSILPLMDEEINERIYANDKGEEDRALCGDTEDVICSEGFFVSENIPPPIDFGGEESMEALDMLEKLEAEADSATIAQADDIYEKTNDESDIDSEICDASLDSEDGEVKDGVESKQLVVEPVLDLEVRIVDNEMNPKQLFADTDHHDQFLLDDTVDSESDISDSSSRSILRSPLTKISNYLKTSNPAEDESDDLLEWINANEDLEPFEVQVAELIEDRTSEIPLEDLIGGGAEMQEVVSHEEEVEQMTSQDISCLNETDLSDGDLKNIDVTCRTDEGLSVVSVENKNVDDHEFVTADENDIDLYNGEDELEVSEELDSHTINDGKAIAEIKMHTNDLSDFAVNGEANQFDENVKENPDLDVSENDDHNAEEENQVNLENDDDYDEKNGTCDDSVMILYNANDFDDDEMNQSGKLREVLQDNFPENSDVEHRIAEDVGIDLSPVETNQDFDAENELSCVEIVNTLGHGDEIDVDYGQNQVSCYTDITKTEDVSPGTPDASNDVEPESTDTEDDSESEKLDRDLFDDVLSLGSLGSFEDQSGNLEIVDSNLCRENSFVNEAIIVQLSNENAENKAESKKVGDAGDLREEYRARADLQNLPVELLDNLPLTLSPRSALNSVTMMHVPFIGETTDADSQSYGSIPDYELSDSEDEIEFGLGHEKRIVLQSENLPRMEDQIDDFVTEEENSDEIAQGINDTQSSDDIKEQGLLGSVDNELKLDSIGDDEVHNNFTNEWFVSSKNEEDYVSSQVEIQGKVEHEVRESKLIDASEDSGNYESENMQLKKRNDSLIEDDAAQFLDHEAVEAKDISFEDDGIVGQTDLKTKIGGDNENVPELNEFEDFEEIDGKSVSLEFLDHEAVEAKDISFEDDGIVGQTDLKTKIGGDSENVPELNEFEDFEEIDGKSVSLEQFEAENVDDLKVLEELENLVEGERCQDGIDEDFVITGSDGEAESKQADFQFLAGPSNDNIGESSEQVLISVLDEILQEEKVDKENLMEVEFGIEDFLSDEEDDDNSKYVIPLGDVEGDKQNDKEDNASKEELDLIVNFDDELHLAIETANSNEDEFAGHDSRVQSFPENVLPDTKNKQQSLGEELYEAESNLIKDIEDQSHSDEDVAVYESNADSDEVGRKFIGMRVDRHLMSIKQETAKIENLVIDKNFFDVMENHHDKSTRGDFETLGRSNTQAAQQSTGVPIVIDNGSGRTKAGFATSDCPSVVIPAIIGRPNYEQVMNNPGSRDYYVGEQAEHYRGVLKLTYPLEHGIITDWDGMEKIWDHVFRDQLRVDSTEHPVLLTEAPFNPKKNRERMLEIMMETYQVPAFYIAIQAVLSLYVTGMTTGVVVDSGDGVTHIVPVYDGYSLPHATERIDIAGRDLTEYLMRILMEGGYSFRTSAEREICRDIKEKLCFVATDFQETLQNFGSNPDDIRVYMLPDGQTISVGNERFRCPEVLFQPSLIGKDIPGIQEFVYKSIQRCDVDIRSEMYSNIILSGGTSMLQGMDVRLKTELEHLVPNSAINSIKIKGMKQREFSVWCGGAALASLPSFSRMWIDSDEYYECGLDIVHRKCF